MNLPSHLSQPSQSENVPIFGRGTRCYFAPEKSRFWSKPREGKGKFTATPRLAPVARGVAACGPLCGLAGRRWGTDTLQPIWARVGELFGAPKAEQEKGIGAFLRQCRPRQPAVRTATRVCGVLRLTLIVELQMDFDAIFCKNARQPRVYKAFGTRRHTQKGGVTRWTKTGKAGTPSG